MPNQKLLRILLQMLFAEKRVDDSLVQIWKLKLGQYFADNVLLRLLLLLMLMMRSVLTTALCRFGS